MTAFPDALWVTVATACRTLLSDDMSSHRAVISDARVEHGVRKVPDEVRDDHQYRGEEEDPLDDRIVVDRDDLVHEIPHARVGKDDLNKVSPGEYRAETEGQRGDARQYGV